MGFSQRIGHAVLELSIDGGAFVAGAENAKATMRDLSRGLQQVQRDIGKQAFQFSGRQQIADAAKMAEAVARVGGASKLVAADQARVNATIKQGIEYYKVLGKEAPTAWMAIEKATRSASQVLQQHERSQKAATDSVLSFAGATQVAMRALGGFLGASAIIGAVKQTIEYGGALQKAQVALNTTALATQRLENIAVSGSTSLEALSMAITTMQDRAAGGDASAARAFSELGLSIDQVLSMSPDAQFIAIATAIQKVNSSAKQIQLGKDIFGPRTVEIMGAIRGEVEKTADSVRTISEREAAELAKAEEGWNKLYLAAKRYSGLLLSNGMNLFAGEQNTFGPFSPNGSLGFVTNQVPVAPPGWESTEASTRNSQAVSQWMARLKAQAEQGRLTTPAITREQAEVEVGALTDWTAAIKAAQSELGKLSTAERQHIKDAERAGASNEVQAAMLQRFGVSAKNADVVLRLLNETQKKTVDEWQRMLDRFNSVEQRNQAVNIAKAIANGQIDLKRVTDESQQAISKALEEGAAAWKAWGGVVPAEIQRAIDAANRYKHSVLPILNDLKPNFGEEPKVEDIEKNLDAFDRPIKSRIELEREAAKTAREIEFQRAEFAIEQAKKSGASIAHVYAMESALSKAKTDAAIADARREYEEKKKILERDIKASQSDSTDPSHYGPARPAATPLVPGNIDLFRQPVVQNPDGSYSTVDSLSVNMDDREVLLPTVTPDGRHFTGPDSVQQAIEEYKRTGRHLGMFATPEDADAYASQLHDDYAAGKYAPTADSVSDAQKELDALTRAHELAAQKIREQWEQEEQARRDEMRRSRMFWNTELGKMIKGELRGIQQDLTGHLFSTLFAGVDDSMKKQAKSARENYERIKQSGKASAEEITRAYRAMRDAEEASQSRWADRFISIWESIKRRLLNIFDQILEAWVNQLLKGMMSALARTAIGQKLIGWATSMIPGLGGATTAATLASTSAVPTTAELLGAAPAAAASSTAATSSATGTTATATGIGVGGALAFAAPVGLGIWALTSPASRINPELRKYILDRTRNRANDPNYDWRKLPSQFLGWQKPTTTSLDQAMAMPTITPDTSVESVASAQSRGWRARPAVNSTTINFNIKAWDGEDVHRAVRTTIAPELKSMMRLNTDDFGYEVRRTVSQ